MLNHLVQDCVQPATELGTQVYGQIGLWYTAAMVASSSAAPQIV